MMHEVGRYISLTLTLRLRLRQEKATEISSMLLYMLVAAQNHAVVSNLDTGSSCSVPYNR